jgi:hypothetical protein
MNLHAFVPPHLYDDFPFDALTEQQQEVVAAWGLHMFGLGQHTFSEIDEVKYDGRLVILADGSRWEVESYEAHEADLWSGGDKVIVVDETMYNLEDCDSVTVSPES